MFRVHVSWMHFIFRFENGQENKSICSIHAQYTSEMSKQQAQLTDDWRESARRPAALQNVLLKTCLVEKKKKRLASWIAERFC